MSDATAIQSGILLLPFSLGSALISVVGNLYMKSGGKPKHLVVLGLGIAALGYGASHSAQSNIVLILSIQA